MSLFGFQRWPLRVKMLALLLLASSLPVAVASITTFVNAKQVIIHDTASLLEARADQLVAELDGFHRIYSGLAVRLSRFTPMVEACSTGGVSTPLSRAGVDAAVHTVLQTDSNVMGITLTNEAGDIIYDSEGPNAATIPAQRSIMAAARSQGVFVSDVYLARPNTGSLPLISYGAPLYSGNGTCAAVIHVRASAFWDAVRNANGRVGEGSYTVVLNQSGVRIAHSFRQNQVFHATGTLAPDEAKHLVDVQQYGQETEALVSDVIFVEEEFERARAPVLSAGLDHMFEYKAPETHEVNFGIARRMTTAHWTVFAITPERSVLGAVAFLVKRTLWLSASIVIVALLLGLWFSERISRPLRVMSAAAEEIASGNLNARIVIHTSDEFGELGHAFNRMAEALTESYDTLEQRVRDRTLSLERANEELQAQKEELIAQRTELQAQQRELQIKNHEVERAGRLKTDFLSNMSHELRTPLNSIIGFSELLVEQTRDRLVQREQRYLEDVLTSGRHLLSLINDILDLSKIEAGHVTLELATIRPSDAITEARELVDSQSIRRKVVLQQKIDVDTAVKADPGKLRQILLNLVSNAIKFSPENGTVFIGTEAAGEFVRFFVRDSGPGIDESLRQRLFQPFVQGESPLVKSFQGTGLGLAISKRLVEQHGGQIDVISPPGEGATFRFTVPRAEAGIHAPAKTDSGPLVLVVDDDRRSSTAIKDILSDAGYAVAKVETTNDPTEMVSRLKPAALVVNPETDERDALRIIDQLKRHEATRSTPIVVTAAPKATDFVPKPIETQRFLDEVRELAPPKPTHGAPCIIAIDDDAKVGLLLSGLLEPAGYHVQTFERGRLGIEAAQAKPPALIIVDLLMPEMSGFEVIDALVSDARTRDVPIIVLTAADTSDSDRARMKQHVRAIAQKGSITRDDLLAAVARATGRAKATSADDAKTVLVIDDHDLNRELARSLLEHLGYRVVLAEDGDAGIAAARREQPSLVFMDLAMPKKDGFTAARELKNDPRTTNIPIVALTAMAMRGDEEKAFDAGMDGYLTKPIDRKALEGVLTKFIGPAKPQTRA